MKRNPIIKIVTFICILAMLASAFIPAIMYIWANFFSNY